MLNKTHVTALTTLADVLTEPHDLDEALAAVTSVTCQLMGTRQAGILLRDEQRKQLIVHSLVGVDSPQVKIGHPLEAPLRLQEILWKVRTTHRIDWLQSGVEGIVFPILSTPIRIRGKVVGLMITGDMVEEQDAFDPDEKKLYKVVATLASMVIERAKAYDYLHNSFALRAQIMLENDESSEGKEGKEELMVASLTNPDKVVRLLATSFYKELEKAGFGPSQITVAAAQLLDCMIQKK